MHLGSDSSPAIFTVLQPATAIKFKVRLGWRPDLILFHVMNRSNGNMTPGMVFDYHSGNPGRWSTALDTAKGNKNEYVKVGSDDDNGIILTENGFEVTEKISAWGGKGIIFMCFKSTNDVKDFSALTDEPDDKDFGSGKLFTRSETIAEVGRDIEVYSV